MSDHRIGDISLEDCQRLVQERPAWQRTGVLLVAFAGIVFFAAGHYTLRTGKGIAFRGIDEAFARLDDHNEEAWAREQAVSTIGREARRLLDRLDDVANGTEQAGRPPSTRRARCST